MEDSVLHNSAIGAADCEPLIPEIPPVDSASGSTARQRIGDRITPKSLTVEGMLSLNTVHPASSEVDIYVRLIIASQKDVKTGAAILGGGISTDVLLRPGFGGTANEVAFAGNVQELMYPINKDKYRVYVDRVYRLGQRKDGGVENITKFSHPYSYTFSQLPSSLTFDEENGNWPNNFAPFVAVGYAYSDGTAPDTVATKLTHTCFSQLTFEDM